MVDGQSRLAHCLNPSSNLGCSHLESTFESIHSDQGAFLPNARLILILDQTVSNPASRL